ncbi:MAG: C39 family peptidase [Agathobaculum sp.]|uniref:C39 family peptidase n=1 Tax=Agathobaculum sp. TaxID=2048138 RepID=UPI002A8357AA|nr:C39 family peptidase [Agathobaculum sp.]MDY3711642.1 C39 family peptidase [Agathobaculum sp.]
MKKRKKHKFRNTLMIIILLILCVGGAELAVCYWVDRPVFYKIVTPVRRQAVAAWNASTAWLDDRREQVADKFAEISEAIEEKRQEKEQAEIESQEAGEPLLLEGGMTINDPEVTELVVRDGQEILTGGAVSIAYFAQSDPAWKEQRYGSDPIGSYGCGPTALAMAVKSFGTADTDPAQMAQWCAAQGFWAVRSGSYHTIVRGVAKGYGLVCTTPSRLTAEELRTQLSGGRIAVALMKPGHFTSTGHFILLRGITLEGNILVADPNSRARSLQAWDAQMIIDELSGSRDSGAPLWFLSLP